MDYPVEVLVLSKSEIESVVTRQDVRDAVETAFRAHGTPGDLTMPQKFEMHIGPPENRNIFVPMPTYVKPVGGLGIKWVSVYMSQKLGIPNIWGSVIILNDPDTGLPYAITDATAITNLRTAGGHCPIAAKYLAKKNSKILAIIGCGFQARTGLPSFNDIFPLQTVKVYDIRPEAMWSFKEEMSQQVKAEILPSKSAQEAVEGADIVLMVSFAKQPVVMEDMVDKGCCVTATMRFQDLDPRLSKKADKWVLGSRSSDGFLILEFYNCKKWDKIDIKLSPKDVFADMGEIVTVQKPGRENDKERILYTHMGMGAHDIVLAKIAYQKAKEKGIGTKVKLV